MEQNEVVVKTQPPKKPRSEAQKAHTNVMLAKLKAKREANRSTQEIDAATEPPKVIIEQPAKPVVQKQEYLTKNHLESFKKELLSSMPSPGERIVEKPVERIVEKPVERIVERPVERIVEREKIVHLSGNALLDKIFFGK